MFTTLTAWGYNYFGQLGDGSYGHNRTTPVEVSNLGGAELKAIAAGSSHSLALKADGTVLAWGDNTSGQLGDGTNDKSTIPVQVEDPNDLSGFLSGVNAIAVGWSHSLALKDDGTVWAWGENRSGQLGNGSTTNSNTPVQVSDLDGVKAVAAGWGHSLALKDDGTVWAWGDNQLGQLSDGTNANSSTPVQVSNLDGVQAIAAGSDHSLAGE